MKRSQILLSVLAAVLLSALFWVLLYNPAREQVAEIELAIVDEQTQQQQLQQEIVRLRAVRDEAPEVEAELAAAESIVPREAALPTALRQLQLAADESGVVLQAVTTSRPVELEADTPPPAVETPSPEDTPAPPEDAPSTPVDAPPPPGDTIQPQTGLSSIEISVQLLGGYFQVVDFLRRIEDPAISPRGLTWGNATLARGEEYPVLDVALTGNLYAVIDVPPPPAAEPDPSEPPVEGEEGETPDDTDADNGTDADDDVEEEGGEDDDADVDVDVNLEAAAEDEA